MLACVLFSFFHDNQVLKHLEDIFPKPITRQNTDIEGLSRTLFSAKCDVPEKLCLFNTDLFWEMHFRGKHNCSLELRSAAIVY